MQFVVDPTSNGAMRQVSNFLAQSKTIARLIYYLHMIIDGNNQYYHLYGIESGIISI
jgi:hypothetical protein